MGEGHAAAHPGLSSWEQGQPGAPERIARLKEFNRGKLWSQLEYHMGSFQGSDTVTRTNLVSGASKTEAGLLVRRIPSDTIRSGPILDLRKALKPDFRFRAVQANEFTT